MAFLVRNVELSLFSWLDYIFQKNAKEIYEQFGSARAQLSRVRFVNVKHSPRETTTFRSGK